MGWTCQHDHKGYCKLLKKECIPGVKGCILVQGGYTFSTGSYEKDKEELEKSKDQEIDFASLAKSN